MGAVIAIILFLIVAVGLSVYGLRRTGKSSQFITMAIFSGAVVLAIAALAALTFLNIGRS
jgi:fucose permease